MKKVRRKDSSVGATWGELLTAVGMTGFALAVTLPIVWWLGFRRDIALIINGIFTTFLVNGMTVAWRKPKQH